MCDILIALSDTTSHGRVVFGKNSDRPAAECQVLTDSAGEKRVAGGVVRCAFVEVPEHPAPLRTIGCRPYWCRGYETGMNEAGVVGGNTAVYTRSFREVENRREYCLTGMELLRFGLERGGRAESAVSAIVELLQQYGQWAPALPGRDATEGCYENAFLLADRDEAWILETTGRRWAARRLTGGTHALSNQLTIRTDWTSGSEDLADYARKQGWCKADHQPFDYALAYSDHEHYARQVSHIRWSRARQLLAESSGGIDVAVMMSCLRDHYEGTFLGGPQFHEYLPDFLTLCMHESPAAFTWGNTVTSVVIEVDPDSPTSSPYWCCYQPPCSSVYVAYTIDAGVPATVSAAGTAGLRSESPETVSRDTFRRDALWWRMHRIVGAISQSPAERRRRVRSLFDPIEKKYIERVRSLHGEPAASRKTQAHRSTGEQLSEVEEVLNQLEREWNVEGTTPEIGTKR